MVRLAGTGRFASGFYVAVVIAAALMASPADAQTVPAQTPAPAPAPAPTPPEPPHKFSGSATVSASVETGRTDLTGIQLDLGATRPYSANGDIDISFSYAYATTADPGESRRQTVADRLTTSFDLEHNFRKREVMMLRAQALRDPIAHIRYRIAESAGYGLRLGDKRVKARIVPGVGVINDDKNLDTDGFRVHYGLYEDITATITPAWTFTNYLSLSRSFTDTQDIIAALDATLTGTVTKKLAIQLHYIYNYEKELPPGVEPKYQKTMVGLQFSF